MTQALFMVKYRTTWKTTYPLHWQTFKVLHTWALFCKTTDYAIYYMCEIY